MSFRRKSARAQTRAIVKGQTIHMQITTGELAQAADSLAALGSCAFSGKNKLLVTLALRELFPKVQAFNEARLEIFKRHGDLSDDKRNYNLREGADTDAANAELKELLETPLDIRLSKLPASIAEAADIAPLQLLPILWLFEDIQV